MTTTDAVTVREQIEADCRARMADLTKSRGFDSGKVRAHELEQLDALFDMWNDCKE